jgi:Protein of unknown function (DUF3429)
MQRDETEFRMISDRADQGLLQQSANRLGYAGLVPQALALFLVLDGANRYVGLAAGYFYAALILSFLGGLWWGLAVGSPKAPQWIYVAAVTPSLLAFATGIPWMNGSSWPGPSLIVLSVALVASLAVDLWLKRLGLMSDAMFALRMQLSLGLGALTLALGVLA